MASVKSIQHFTHFHPLTEVYAGIEFLCDGCKTPGNGPRYRCEACNFNLHECCATCPEDLSSFMLEDHHLKLVFKPRAFNFMGQLMNCDLCGDPVDGLFYECNSHLCGPFNLHPLCTQLPQYVFHVKDKAHPLTLQRCVTTDNCTVCKNVCSSWRYRCGVCCLDLHPECVLAPCEEVMSSTSASRSLTSSPFPPPPSASAPILSFYNDPHGYGPIARPTYPVSSGYGELPLAAYVTPNYHAYNPSCGVNNPPHPYGYGPIARPPYSESYGYSSVPPSPSYLTHYAHGPGYGAIQRPPYFQSSGYGEVPLAAYVTPCYAHNPSCGVNIPPNPYLTHCTIYGGPPFAAHHFAGPRPRYEIPSTSSHSSGEYNVSNIQHSNGQVQTGSGGFRKKMYAIIKSLALGVASNALFGVISLLI